MNKLFVTSLLFILSGLSSVVVAQTTPLIYESSDGRFTYVLHDGLSPDDIKPTATILEDNYKLVLTLLTVESLPQVSVTIWDDAERYYQVQEETMGMRYEGSGGYAWWGVVPELRLRHSSWSGASIAALHEFAHIVSMVKNGSIPNNPRWLWEAVAIYATQNILSEPELPEYIVAGDYPTLVELDLGFNEAGEQRNIYQVGYFLADYIVQIWGRGGLIKLIETNGAVENTLNISVTEFEQGWAAYLQENYIDKDL